MLTIEFGTGNRDCSGMPRRDFLRIGSLSLGGLSLPGLLATQADAAGRKHGYFKDKSVVLLYLSGGASQIETFDPKMTAPDGIRSATGEVKTSLPGVTFGGTFPLLAKLAGRMAIVRSHAHSVGSHEQAHVHVLSGGTDPRGTQQKGFSIGSCFARLRGTNHERTGLPTYVGLNEQEVDGQYLKEIGRFNKGSWPGELGQSFGPFVHQVGWSDENLANGGVKQTNPIAANMRLNIAKSDLDNRLKLLKSIDSFNRKLDAGGTMAALDEFSAQAVTVLLGNATQALDFQHEDRKTIARYDTSDMRIGHKKFRPSTLGKQMLVARRLCEAGAGFVSVHSAGWDMHADKNNPGVVKGMNMLGPTLDRSVSAFLEDVENRGLCEKILLVIVGDFGRSPKIDKNGGRGHWAKLCPLVFAGGGLRMGQVIGESNAKAEVPATAPISPTDMMATVLHALFDVGEMRLDSSVPRNISQHIERGRRIEELF
ncbi:MAG: DUF1501 domain-containing protein [Planctomycetota bacterium]|nr:DUF1501 domain-containing protein [Planctomycetota bacterium]